MVNLGAPAARARRRTLLAGGAAVALGGCAAMIEEARRGPAPTHASGGAITLAPLVSLSQGMLAGARDRAGVPMPDGSTAPLRLVRPIAVAARDGEVYVADAGTAAVYRVEPASGWYARVSGTGPVVDVRLELAPDRSLVMIDRASRRVSRWLPGGARAEPWLAPSTELGQPTDIALDATRGRVLVADGLYRQLVAFGGGGGAWSIVALRGEPPLAPRALSRIAAGPNALYAADPEAGAVLIVAPDGPVTGRIVLPAPGPIDGLAVDGAGRLFVADGRGRELRVFAQGRLLQSISYRTLRVAQVADLRVADGVLWIADPASSRVESWRILPRREP